MSYSTNVQNRYSGDSSRYRYKRDQADARREARKEREEALGREAQQEMRASVRKWKKIGNQYK